MSKVLYILLAGAIAVVLVLLLPPGPSKRLASGLRYVSQPAQTWADWAGRVSRAAVGNPEAEQVPDTTAAANNALEALRRTQLEFNALQNENHRLRQQLRWAGERAQAFTEAYTVALARVVRRDPLVSYYDAIVIDKGRNDGIREGHYVVATPAETPTSEPRLIGVVSEVSATSSRVMLISYPEAAIACYIPSRRVTGLLYGTIEESTQENPLPAIGTVVNKLILANPAGADYDAIAVGDKVYTSAQGDNEEGVPDLLIGTVAQMTQAANGLPEIHLTPSAPLGQFDQVLVVLKAKGKNGK